MKNIYLYLLFFPYLSFNSFLLNNNKIKSRKKSYLEDKDILRNIEYNLEYKEVIKNINGFFGNIGPNIKDNNNNSLHELFMGNGVINGIFFNKGNITYIKSIIKTDKYLHEKIRSTFDFSILKKNLFHRNIFFPNILGAANTAFLNIKDKYYALHERDQPYLLNIHFSNQTIETKEKMNLKNMNHFCAHSKFNNDKIETMDYKLFEKTVTYFQLTENFEYIISKKFKMKYLPLTHDFISNHNSLILFDFPIKIDIKNFFIDNKKIPLLLDKNKPTFIYVWNKNNGFMEEYKINTSFFIFHYANFIEKEDFIEIYASIYDDLNFLNNKLNGSYRKLIINKKTKEVIMEKRDKLEKKNIDFPIKFKDKIILQCYTNQFIICKDLEIVKTIKIPKGKINGEHKIIYIKNKPYLICFSTTIPTQSFLIIINLINYKRIEIPLNQDLNIGFHSIFIEK